MEPQPFSSSPAPTDAASVPLPAADAALANPTVHGATPDAAPGAAPGAPTGNAQWGTIPPAATTPSADPQLAVLTKRRDVGANWFFWIAALSVINSGAVLLGADRTFSLGLAFTLIVDTLTHDAGSQGLSAAAVTVVRMLGLGFNLLVVGCTVLWGVLARKGYSWAFWVGGILYLLDTCIYLLVRDPLGIILHIWALISLWSGLKANQQLQAMQRAAAQTASGSAWSSSVT